MKVILVSFTLKLFLIFKTGSRARQKGLELTMELRLPCCSRLSRLPLLDAGITGMSSTKNISNVNIFITYSLCLPNNSKGDSTI